MKNQRITMYILQGGLGGSPTADSRIAVPCPPAGGQERSPKSAPTTCTNR